MLHLLLGRETGLGACHGRGPTSSAGLDSELERWVEDDMVEHTSSDYVTFQPPPRSTIAVAYNSDGSLLASSQCVSGELERLGEMWIGCFGPRCCGSMRAAAEGVVWEGVPGGLQSPAPALHSRARPSFHRSGDHTVKITCCKTHRVLRSLTGHRRTPWAVRFHPRLPHLVASGSLDNEVRLWNARTGECFLQHTFGKPIASLSFHTTSHVLGVACGHKVRSLCCLGACLGGRCEATGCVKEAGCLFARVHGSCVMGVLQQSRGRLFSESEWPRENMW